MTNQYKRFQFLNFMFSSTNYLKKVSDSIKYILFFTFNNKTNEISKKNGENRQECAKKNISVQKRKLWITAPDQKMAFSEIK